MKRGIRDTIRRKPDYERDPDWDIGEVLEGRRKHTKRPNHIPVQRDEMVDEEREEAYPTRD